MLRSILNKLFPPFTKLEQTLVGTVIDACEGETKRLLQAQVRCVNLVQRHRNSKEVILFTMRGFRVYTDLSISFPQGEDEVRFATANITSFAGENLKADFWITRGFFSIIEFNKNPRHLSKQTTFKKLKVTILRDPATISAIRPPERLIDVAGLSTGARNLLNRCNVVKAFCPCERNEIETFLSQSALELPKDLTSFLYECDGFVTEDCEFLGIKAMRVVEHGEEFVIVAEHTRKGVLAFKRKLPEGGYFLLDYEGGDPSLLGTNYTTAGFALCKR